MAKKKDNKLKVQMHQAFNGYWRDKIVHAGFWHNGKLLDLDRTVQRYGGYLASDGQMIDANVLVEVTTQDKHQLIRDIEAAFERLKN